MICVNSCTKIAQAAEWVSQCKAEGIRKLIRGKKGKRHQGDDIISANAKCSDTRETKNKQLREGVALC